MRTAILGSAILAISTGMVGAEMVVLEPVRDATLIQDPDGALANGSGPVFFAGRNNQAINSIRRSLIHFDVAGALPANALIENVSLRLFMTPSNQASRLLRLHRVLTDWAEGPAGASGGGGAPAQAGDVTWLHTYWDTDFWVRPGGQFVGRDSAIREVGASGFYIWSSTPHLVQDVQLWNQAPSRNFGWILLGDEREPQTAKSFASREHPDPLLRPVLVIVYRMPGEPPGP